MRLVINRDVGVHLPHPGILHWEGQGLAGTVTLEREYHQRSVATFQERGRTGFDFTDPIHHRDRRQFEPPSPGGLLCVGDLGGGVGCSGPGRTHTGLNEEPVLAVTRGVVQHHRQHVGYWRPRIAALCVGPLPTEHQQAAAAFADKVGDHSELVGGEVIRLDAAQDNGAVLEQFFTGPGESTDQILRVLDADPHEFVFGGSLQHGHLQILVVLDGASDELEFPAWLALEVQDLLACVFDDDQRVPLVVLGDHFVRARGHAETEQTRTGVRCREPDSYGGRLAVGGECDLLVGDDPALVFHLDAHGLARIAVLRQQDVDDQCGTLQDRPRRIHSAELNVTAVVLTAQADCEHRNTGCLKRNQRIGQLDTGVVCAVRDHHHSRERHPSQFLVCAGECLSQVGSRAVERQVVDGRNAVGRRGEAEQSQREAIRQRSEQRALFAAELLGHEVGAGLPVAVGDLHAARVVDQDTEEVLLGHHL